MGLISHNLSSMIGLANLPKAFQCVLTCLSSIKDQRVQ